MNIRINPHVYASGAYRRLTVMEELDAWNEDTIAERDINFDYWRERNTLSMDSFEVGIFITIGN